MKEFMDVEVLIPDEATETGRIYTEDELIEVADETILPVPILYSQDDVSSSVITATDCVGCADFFIVDSIEDVCRFRGRVIIFDEILKREEFKKLPDDIPLYVWPCFTGSLSDDNGVENAELKALVLDLKPCQDGIKAVCTKLDLLNYSEGKGNVDA